MYKYQNVSEVTQTLTNSGNISPRIVKPGETVESDTPIENPNFQYVGSQTAVTAEDKNQDNEETK